MTIADEAETLVRGYLDLLYGRAEDMAAVFAPEAFDHVSERRFVDSWGMVTGWIRGTFADSTVEIHEIMTKGDRVMLWMTATGTHIGSLLPRLRGIEPTGRTIAWSSVHIFRVVEGRFVEHWAVRDDYGMVEAVAGGGPLVAPAAIG